MNRDTICVQGGYTPGNGEPRQIPIIQSTTFKYDTSEDMGKLFDLEADGYFYSRLQNPTCDAVARKIAALEGGTAAMLTSSGQAANFFALFNICQCGDHIVSSSTIYGGTFNLISVTMAKMGIDVTFVSPTCTEEELDAAFRPNTKAVFGETIANPALTVLDIEKFARAAHAHGVPLIVDNTFPTPVNCRPIEWGADIVTHSTTKYMDGHGAAVGGAIVDSGKFDWMAHADKFPGLCTPDESYHGITYAERFGRGGSFHHQGDRPADAGLWLLPVPPVGLHPQPGPGEPARADGPPLRERPGGGPLPGTASQSGLCGLLRTGVQPLLSPGPEVPAPWQLRRGVLRAGRGPRGSQHLHEVPAAGRHRDPCGRCAHLLPESRLQHSPADER